jgi:hypothetical protein
VTLSDVLKWLTEMLPDFTISSQCTLKQVLPKLIASRAQVWQQPEGDVNSDAYYDTDATFASLAPYGCSGKSRAM